MGFVLFGVAMISYGWISLWLGDSSIGLSRTNVEYRLSGALAVANTVALSLFGAAGIAMGLTNRRPLLVAAVGALGIGLWLLVLAASAVGAG